MAYLNERLDGYCRTARFIAEAMQRQSSFVEKH